MKSKILLRVAAVIMLLHDVGHTFGHLTWRQTDDPIKKEVIKQMTENKFPFMGTTRGIAEYFEGYGWAGSLALLLMAAILWISSSAPSASAVHTKQTLSVMSFILLAWGIDELIFFFPFAAAFSLIACALTVIATVRLKQV